MVRGLLGCPLEGRGVNPHAIKNDGERARDGDFGLAHAAAPGDPEPPRLQSGAFGDPRQQNVGRLEQVTAQHGVAAL